MKAFNLQTSIHDALGFAKNCQLYVKGIGHERFRDDLLAMSAVQYNLIVLSEALKRIGFVSPKNIERDLEKKFIALGEELIDKYNNVDSYKVWMSINTDLPSLINALEKLLSDKK